MPPIKTKPAPMTVTKETGVQTVETPLVPPKKETKTKKGANGKAPPIQPPEKTQAPAKGKGKKETPPVEEEKRTEEEQHTEVVYDKVSVVKCEGDGALTADGAKKLLGWDDANVTDKNYLLTDIEGKKVRCHHNPTNRPFTYNLAKTWASEILHNRWKLNGETIIVSRTGLILSGQHRLTGLVLAVQEWTKDPEKWAEYWKTEPSMETIIVRGISDAQDTVNTIDTGKPRSLADVIYRSHYFASVPASSRQALASLSKAAIQLLWHRTGSGIDAWSPSKRTHGESLEFLDNHTRLLECVKHVYEEDGSGKEGSKISKYIYPGYAAAMLYMMASGTSDSAKYKVVRNESVLTWDLWERACDFWIGLAQREKSFKEVYAAYSALWERAGRHNQEEAIAILSKAWACVATGKPITAKALELKYTEDKDGKRKLSECPTVGGIDLGNPQDDDEADTEDDGSVAPSPAEIKKRQKAEGAKPDSKATGKIKPKEVVYVQETEDSDSDYMGTVEEIYSNQTGQVAKVKIAEGFAGAGKIFEVNYKHLSRTARG